MLVFETPGAGAYEVALQVDAFAAAARERNFDALVAILHPNGARGWTGAVLQPALVYGAAGLGFFHADSLLGV
ncbi:MAG: hypothetical protein JO318_00055 [Chloroflexi bacterium]|nr:hypothetical protein [Chloroflexota bacterium]